MLAYYLGFQYSELDEMAKSRYYYTIAGLHENAPTASQILAVLASPTHDQKQIAQKFLLMAASTPNTQENKQCIQTALEVFDMVQKSPTFSENWIENFETIEKSLTPVAEPKE